MRGLILRSAVCCVGLVLVSGVALAQSDPCEGLQGATPGLYGLCIAFHNVEPCVPNPLTPDPFAACEPKDGRLLEAYNNLRGPDDPRMPGTGDDCPCFTLLEMETWAAYWVDWAPSQDPPVEYAFDICAIESPYLFHSSPNWPRSETISSFYHNDPVTQATVWGGQATRMEMADQTHKARPIGLCRYVTPDAGLTTIYGLQDAEITECETILETVIRAYEDECAIFCDPDCPE